MLTHLPLFNPVEFRAILAALVAFATVFLLGKPFIRMMLRRKVGDIPNFNDDKLNELTKNKANVPTMGGLLIVGATVLACLLLGDLSREHGFYLWTGLVCLIGHATIGCADDLLKLRNGRIKAAGGKVSRDGLKSWEKMLCQLALAAILCRFIFVHAETKYLDGNPYFQMSTCLNLPGLKSWVTEKGANGVWHHLPSPNLIVLSLPWFLLIGVSFISGFSNAVNITDGIDGLAGGVSVVACFALALVALIAGHGGGGLVWAQKLLAPHVPDAGELAVLAAAMGGACIGFLWFNSHPAQLFMGDTGSLALGGTMGCIAVVTRQEFLLLLIGGVFIAEIGSVAIQVSVFRLSKGRLGFHRFPDGSRRVFGFTPIHHHFHRNLGMAEQKIVSRAVLLTMLLGLLALGTVWVR